MQDQPRHFQTAQTERRSRWSPVTCFVLAIVADAVLSVLMEAGTLFGSFTLSVADPSAWMPKRLLTFFVLLLLPSLLLVFRLARRRTRTHAARAKLLSHVAHCLMNVAIVTLGLVIGIALGKPLGEALAEPQDARFGLALACLIIAVALLVANRKTISMALEWGFLVLALCFGSTFCLLMPTAAEISWDGQTHFKKATALSFLYDAEYTGADQIMVTAGPEGALYATGDLANVEELEVELGSRTIPFPHASMEDEDVFPANDVLQQAEDTGDTVRMTHTLAYPSGTYFSASSLGLIPNAVGLWVGRLLHAGCALRYLLARFSNMLFYVVIFFFAIRSLKEGKLIVAAIGLSPTALLMAANFSYDPWHICLTTLAFARLVGSLQRGEALTTTDSLSMLVPFVLGAFVKAVVFPLALLFALIPRRSFASTKRWAAHLGLVALSILLLLSSFALPFLVSVSQEAAAGDARGGTDVSRSKQVAYVLAHPLQTLEMGVIFALRMLNPAILGCGLTPSDENLLYYFPYLTPTNAPLNELGATAEFLLLLCASLLDGGEEDENFAAVRYKVGSLVFTALSFALIAGALYVDFTAVGRDTISGVQYRYLFALLAPLTLLLPNTAWRRSHEATPLRRSFVWIETLLLTVVLWNSFVRLF